MGSVIASGLEYQSFNSVFLTPDSLDWADAPTVADCFALHQPDIVINSGLPYFSAPDSAFSTYAKASQSIARGCLVRNSVCLQLSSFEVYDESLRRPEEGDEPNPSNARGHKVLQADQAISAVNHSIILRLGWLVGDKGENMLSSMVSQLIHAPEQPLNNHFKGSPTTYTDVARVLIAMVKQIDCGADNWGVIHYSAEGFTTEFKYASKIADQLRRQGVDVPELIGKEDVECVHVPNRSGLLDCVRSMANFGIQPRPYDGGIEEMVSAYLPVMHES